MVIQFFLKNPEYFEQNISTRVPTILRIVPPLRMQVETLRAPSHTGIKAVGTKTPDYRPCGGHIELSRSGVPELQRRRLVRIAAPHEPGLKYFRRATCGMHKCQDFESAGLLQPPAN